MTSAASNIIRVLFLIVLACHIPYIFYSGKESLLIIVDEIRYQSMTHALELVLQNSVIGATQDRDIDGDFVEQPSLMMYKQMDPTAYYGISITIYFCEIALSTLIPNVGTLFDFISVFSISSILYIFPGLFYFLCERKYG